MLMYISALIAALVSTLLLVRVKVLVSTYKALYGIGPSYLRDLLPPIASA